MLRGSAEFGCVMLLVLPVGCAQVPKVTPRLDRVELERRAFDCLKAAVRYEHNPSVRIEAVEALESSGREEALPWIRSALLDEHPAVRFAASVAVGRSCDAMAEQRLRALVDDKDASVQVAALFALHRLGYEELTGRIPTYLLQHEDVTVRRNAALVLGFLDEPGAIKILARAMRDGDEGVRKHALEAMARLGNQEARQELAFMTNSGVGSDEVFAISALAETGDRIYLDAFRYKLTTAVHLETRLAAARALGRLGSDEGFDVAMKALKTSRPFRRDPDDPGAGQVLRARQLAAAALGAIGRSDALPACAALIGDPTDPRVQVSAARAVLEIAAAQRQDFPLSRIGSGGH